jgi:hypothetical protein
MAFNFDANNALSVTVEGGTAQFVGSEVKIGTVLHDITSEKGKAALEAFAKEFDEFVKVTGHSDAKLNAVYRVFSTHAAAPELAAIAHIMPDYQALRAAIQSGTAEAVENALVRNKNLFNLLPEADHVRLNDKAIFDLDKIQKVAKRISDFEGALVKELDAGKTLTKDALTKILRTHGTDYVGRLSPEIATALNAGPRFAPGAALTEAFTLNSVVQAVDTEIAGAKAEVTNLLNSISSKQQVLDGKRWLKSAAQAEVSSEVKKLQEFLSKNKEIHAHLHETIDGHAGKAFFSKAEGMKGVMESVKQTAKSSPIAGNYLAGAADAGEKLGMWWNSGRPKVEGFKGAMWSNRGYLGRAGIIAGIAAVGYAIVSAIGGRGPGDRAEEVNRSRQGEPAMAR